MGWGGSASSRNRRDQPMNHATVRAATPYGFLLPALVLTALVILFPVVQTIWYSVQDYILYAPDHARFIGFRNFAAAFRDEVFWISLGHSAVWVGGIVFAQFVLGLGTALLLNQSFWWRGLARALVIIPWALPSVIIGLMWTWIYDYNTGVPNDLLIRMVITQPFPWLASPATALACVMLALVWQGFPFFCGDDPRRPANRATRALRGGRDRWRDRLPPVCPRHGAQHRRHCGDGRPAAHHLGRQLARCHPGDDRRRPGLRHAYASALCVPARLYGHGVRLCRGAVPAADADAAFHRLAHVARQARELEA